MNSGGKKGKSGKEDFRSGQPRIKVIAIKERDGMPWFRELRGIDGALYRIYHRRGEMYGFNIETEEIIFERKEGDSYCGMTLDGVLLEQVADIFEFIEDCDTVECVGCFEEYPGDRVPKVCDQCGAEVQ